MDDREKCSIKGCLDERVVLSEHLESNEEGMIHRLKKELAMEYINKYSTVKTWYEYSHPLIPGPIYHDEPQDDSQLTLRHKWYEVSI